MSSTSGANSPNLEVHCALQHAANAQTNHRRIRGRVLCAFSLSQWEYGGSWDITYSSLLLHCWPAPTARTFLSTVARSSSSVSRFPLTAPHFHSDQIFSTLTQHPSSRSFSRPPPNSRFVERTRSDSDAMLLNQLLALCLTLGATAVHGAQSTKAKATNSKQAAGLQVSQATIRSAGARADEGMLHNRLQRSSSSPRRGVISSRM